MGQFCVINANSTKTARNCNRTVFRTEDEAISYAKRLVKNQISNAPTLWVVEVKKVVEVGGPPIEVNDPVDLGTSYLAEDDDE